MNHYICIHGHFYQPPRENPWTESIENQESSYPYHDWNSRICAECYAPNTASRILSKEGNIINIVNNFSKISFNFGPTVLSWMEKSKPDVYQAILDADKESRNNFSGHGTALAQGYNHIIMPLANSRDKRTQILWGIKDFKKRFQRNPEGMWLAETAVDLETLELLSEYGIKFTILAPRQASRVRSLSGGDWLDVSDSRVDPKRPYLLKLSSGRIISLFFYDVPISQGIAFEELLKSAETLTERLMGAFTSETEPQLVHIATDGETYGHHQPFGDMSLTYCLHSIECSGSAKLTHYAEYLEKFPPQYEVEIYENSSWSCIHGIERWRSDCGCNSGMKPGWNQQWRSFLRTALDWLRDNISHLYEEHAGILFKAPWEARNAYIQVILDRQEETLKTFFDTQALRALNEVETVEALKLLEMQRFSLLMYTSCGWFFDELSEIETVQILQYAARVMQLAKEITGLSFEETFIKLLSKAPSNIPDLGNGATIYENYVLPAVTPLLRAGAHYAMTTLFKDYSSKASIYSYDVERDLFERKTLGKQKLATGKARIISKITKESVTISFAVVHWGDQNLVGGVREFIGEEAFIKMQQEITEAFNKGDIPELIHILDSNFKGHTYSLRHLFKDEQIKITETIFDSVLTDMENSFKRVYHEYLPVVQSARFARIPLSRYFTSLADFIFNQEIRQILSTGEFDLEEVKKMSQNFKQMACDLDKPSCDYLLKELIYNRILLFYQNPSDLAQMHKLNELFEIKDLFGLTPKLWKSQNIFFDMTKTRLMEMKKKAVDGDESAHLWIDCFVKLGQFLNVKVE